VALAEVLEPHDSQDREGALDYRVSYANFLYGFDDNGSIRALKLSCGSFSSPSLWRDLGRLLCGCEAVRNCTELCDTAIQTLPSLSRSISISRCPRWSPRDVETTRTPMSVDYHLILQPFNLIASGGSQYDLFLSYLLALITILVRENTRSQRHIPTTRRCVSFAPLKSDSRSDPRIPSVGKLPFGGVCESGCVYHSCSRASRPVTRYTWRCSRAAILKVLL
jgi:hypothetical protein